MTQHDERGRVARQRDQRDRDHQRDVGLLACAEEAPQHLDDAKDHLAISVGAAS